MIFAQLNSNFLQLCSYHMALQEAEFIAAHIAVELSSRYKLKMFGIPIDDPANMYCDSGSIMTNCIKLESD